MSKTSMDYFEEHPFANPGYCVPYIKDGYAMNLYPGSHVFIKFPNGKEYYAPVKIDECGHSVPVYGGKYTTLDPVLMRDFAKMVNQNYDEDYEYYDGNDLKVAQMSISHRNGLRETGCIDCPWLDVCDLKDEVWEDGESDND